MCIFDSAAQILTCTKSSHKQVRLGLCLHPLNPIKCTFDCASQILTRTKSSHKQVRPDVPSPQIPLQMHQATIAPIALWPCAQSTSCAHVTLSNPALHSLQPQAAQSEHAPHPLNHYRDSLCAGPAGAAHEQQNPFPDLCTSTHSHSSVLSLS